MQSDKANAVLSDPDPTDFYTLKIPARLVNQAGFLSGDDIVITVDESSWDDHYNPLTYQITIQRTKDILPLL